MSLTQQNVDLGHAPRGSMGEFTFPALAAGPPSRRNWYKELLDDPQCAGNPARVQEAYETHREAYGLNQCRAFLAAGMNPVTPDQALIKHLERERRRNASKNGPVDLSNDLDGQDVNCLVIWARPPPQIITLIQNLQQRIASLVGPDIYLIPSKDLHLSVIELSHRHSAPHLRAVENEVEVSRIQQILNSVSNLPRKPRLISPQLSFDKMGIALNFIPTKEDPYTYHHLRSDMHALALESGVSIDMCYTAPSAHVTLGRFIGNAFFEGPEGRKEFATLVGEINEELRDSDVPEWVVGKNTGLELQLGYLKFGREREKADMLGKC